MYTSGERDDDGNSKTPQREAQEAEAAAEAGPGAANTNAVPLNETRDDISSETPTVPGQPDGEKPKLTRTESTRLEDKGRARIALIMSSLGMAVFLAALDVTIITTALPTISEYFHSSAGYTWIGSAYLLGNAASVPSWGKISDIWGRKPILLIANIVFMIGSLVAALSNSIGMRKGQVENLIQGDLADHIF